MRHHTEFYAVSCFACARKIRAATIGDAHDRMKAHYAQHHQAEIERFLEWLNPSPEEKARRRAG